MALFQEEENLFVEKFESMLKGNRIIFFDTIEFEEIIQYYLDAGKINKAKRALQVGLEQHPSSTELKLLNAEMLILENRLVEAEDILSELNLLEPCNSEIYIQKANIHSKQNSHEKAIELLEYALTFADESIDVYYLIAMEYLFLDDYSQAKRYFKKCIKEDSSDYISLQQLIFCYDFLEENQEAIDFLNTYLNDNPYCEVAWHHLGRQYLSLGNLQEALRCFDFAIISDDTFTGAYFEKGKVLEQLKQYEEAIKQYEKTLQLDDPTSYAYLRIGKCYEKCGDLNKAESFYLKSVYEDPQSDRAWMALSQLCFFRKEYNRALNAINKAVLIEDMNISYWKHCAEVNLALNQKELAEKALEEAFLLGDYSIENRMKRIQLLVGIEEYEKALSLVESCQMICPNSLERDLEKWRETLMTLVKGK